MFDIDKIWKIRVLIHIVKLVGPASVMVFNWLTLMILQTF